MHRTISVIALLLFTASTSMAADQPRVGDAAPDFELRDQNGQMHTLEDYRDHWVALYFYPKDDTPGCTAEACNFRDDIFKYKELDCQILGVSLDDELSHKEFSEKYSLPFPLLADNEGSAADAYGVKSKIFGMTVADRQTFLINPEGKIAIHYEDINPDDHSAQVIADLERLQAQQVDASQ